MDTQKTNDELLASLKAYVENDFWPRHRGIDEATLLMLRTPADRWEQSDIFLASAKAGTERNALLTIAMRQAVAREQPYAVSVVAEARIATDDPHAHYDYVFATLERKGLTTSTHPQILWKLGLDDAALTFLAISEGESVTLGNLYSDADDCIEYWVYTRNPAGGLTLYGQGGTRREKPMTASEIKVMVYQSMCQSFGVKLNERKVLESLVVSFHPLHDHVYRQNAS